ncbi:unnamed protein product [Pelagomonas calceolata]|uniref:Uncharacterized protein n=1 Tax=Pelagomonas calceolata TaxID=35677 RepID=A0A8J2WU60_9STRA|nr:unnamed protein product [Pelagomonas calceolata]
MDHPPTTTADLMRYAVAAPATAVAVPPPPPVAVPPPPIAAPATAVAVPPPPAELDPAALARRVQELEAALASSEAERERLAQRVAALEAEKKHPKPRGRMPLGATGWDHATGTWQYPPGVLPQSPRKRARRASVKARRKWEGESSDEDPPPAVAAGAVFIDDGQCWLVYKREDDVVYYYPAKHPKPTEETYLAACEHSGADEVAAWIAATHERADACARAHRRKRDDERRRRENAALAALPPPKLPPPPKRVPPLPAEQLLGRAVRVVIADAPSDARGTVDAIAHGVCRIAWKDGTRSEVLLADATAMLVPVVAV